MAPIEVPKPNDAEVIKTPEQAREVTRVGIDELRKKLDSSENTPEIKAFLQKLTHIQNDLHTPEERAKDVKELLEMVKNTPTIARNRDVMDFFRQALEGFVIPQDVKDEIKLISMSQARKDELSKSLTINPETLDALDEWTRQIVRRIHTGFYQFDPDINGWVDALGGRLFLWPENIDGIQKYLDIYNKDHPFMASIKSWNFRSHDSKGKYAFTFTGKPHNIHLAEADYLQRYLVERANNPAMTDNQIVAKLRETHAVTVKAQGAIDAFENKYAESSFNAPASAQLSVQSQKISESVLPSKIPEYRRITNLVELEKYEYIVDNQRPEMKDIIYDIATGFVRFDEWTHAFRTVTGKKIIFTEEQLGLIDDVFQDIRPSSPFLKDTQILTNKTSNQYDAKTLRERMNFYK